MRYVVIQPSGLVEWRETDVITLDTLLGEIGRTASIERVGTGQPDFGVWVDDDFIAKEDRGDLTRNVLATVLASAMGTRVWALAGPVVVTGMNDRGDSAAGLDAAQEFAIVQATHDILWVMGERHKPAEDSVMDVNIIVGMQSAIAAARGPRQFDAQQQIIF